MAWPLNTKVTAVLVVLIALSVGITPARIINRSWYLLYHTPSVLFTSLRVPPPAPHTLKAAILNVTADFNELTLLLQDFLRSATIDPSVEISFRTFLAERATRSHPGLENALDWVLALYKFSFPFLIISLLAKLSGGIGSSDGRDDGRYEEERVARPQLELPSRGLLKGPSGGSGGILEKLRQSASPSGPDTPQEGRERCDGGRDLLAAAVGTRASLN